jgi:hypothetical protein
MWVIRIICRLVLFRQRKVPIITGVAARTKTRERRLELWYGICRRKLEDGAAAILCAKFLFVCTKLLKTCTE